LVSDLSPEQCDGLLHWRNFYRNHSVRPRLHARAEERQLPGSCLVADTPCNSLYCTELPLQGRRDRAVLQQPTRAATHAAAGGAEGGACGHQVPTFALHAT
jgi:hypothetical protein